MTPSRIETGRTYLCVFGDARYRATALETSGAVVLVRLDAKFNNGQAVGPSDAPELGTEIWVAPEAVEPLEEARSAG